MAGTIIYKSIIYIYFGRAGRITQNKLERVLSLRASRLWRSVPNALAVAFDRTADLYHVKADWPHQDAPERSETRVKIISGQVLDVRLFLLYSMANSLMGL